MSSLRPNALVPQGTAAPRRHKPWTVFSNTNPQPQRPAGRPIPLTRRYEVTWIDDDGQLDSFVRIAPALPVFEQAFCAFAHGALVSTTEGPVPVEDVEPGMVVE